MDLRSELGNNRTRTVKTLIPLTPAETWDTLVAPEFPPLFNCLPEVHLVRWVGNYLIAQPRLPSEMTVSIARVFNRPHRLEIVSRTGRMWVCLFDPDPLGTVWQAWMEGDFDNPPPAGLTTEERDWVKFYDAYLMRWSEVLSSSGAILTSTIPDDMRFTLD